MRTDLLEFADSDVIVTKTFPNMAGQEKTTQWYSKRFGSPAMESISETLQEAGWTKIDQIAAVGAVYLHSMGTRRNPPLPEESKKPFYCTLPHDSNPFEGYIKIDGVPLYAWDSGTYQVPTLCNFFELGLTTNESLANLVDTLLLMGYASELHIDDPTYGHLHLVLEVTYKDAGFTGNNRPLYGNGGSAARLYNFRNGGDILLSPSYRGQPGILVTLTETDTFFDRGIVRLGTEPPDVESLTTQQLQDACTVENRIATRFYDWSLPQGYPVYDYMLVATPYQFVMWAAGKEDTGGSAGPTSLLVSQVWQPGDQTEPVETPCIVAVLSWANVGYGTLRSNLQYLFTATSINGAPLAGGTIQGTDVTSLVGVAMTHTEPGQPLRTSQGFAIAQSAYVYAKPSGLPDLFMRIVGKLWDACVISEEYKGSQEATLGNESLVRVSSQRGLYGAQQGSLWIRTRVNSGE